MAKYRIKYKVKGLKKAKIHMATEHADSAMKAKAKFFRRKTVSKKKHTVTNINKLSK